jgi:hAT family C-terminal dimerisation region
VVISHERDDEYEHYCSEEPYEREKGQTALQWWCEDQQQKRWPILSQFAIEILSIPAMSDEPERIFSGGRRTISWDRMSLGLETVEQIECSKSWIRRGILED